MNSIYKLVSLVFVLIFWIYVGLRFNHSPIDLKLTTYFKKNGLPVSGDAQLSLVEGITMELINYLDYFNILVGFFVVYLVVDLILCYRKDNR